MQFMVAEAYRCNSHEDRKEVRYTTNPEEAQSMMDLRIEFLRAEEEARRIEEEERLARAQAIQDLTDAIVPDECLPGDARTLISLSGFVQVDLRQARDKVCVLWIFWNFFTAFFLTIFI